MIRIITIIICLIMTGCTGCTAPEYAVVPEPDFSGKEIEHKRNVIRAVQTVLKQQDDPEWMKVEIKRLHEQIRKLKYSRAEAERRANECMIDKVTSHIIIEAMQMMHDDQMTICEMEKEALLDTLELCDDPAWIDKNGTTEPKPEEKEKA